MSITATCTSCGKSFQAPDTFAGKRVKCKVCGTAFTVQGTPPPPPPVDPEIEAMEKLESSDSSSSSSSAQGRRGSKIGPRMETRMPANPSAGEFEFDAPAELSSRANVLRFRYPGALVVDQWLPLTLIVVGFVWLGFTVDQADAKNILWIDFLRFFVPSLLYLALVFPITLALIRKAGRDVRFRMPPSPGLRCFATYLPAFVLGTGLWWVGNGAFSSFLLGGLFGLVLSSAILWLLFRLRETEIGLAAANGAAGFIISSAIAIGILLGLNTVTRMAVVQSKTEASVPASPFGPGLAWIAPLPPPPTAPVVKIKPQPTEPTITGPAARPHPASPLLADLQTNQITGQIDQIIRPFSDGSLIGIVRNANTPQETIESWDELTGQRQPGPLQLPTQPLPVCVLSGNGQHLAWIINWPKLSAQIWSFPGQHVMSKVDLDPTLGTPQLLGFSSPDHLLVRWGGDTGPTAIEVLSLKNQSQVCKFDTLKRDSNSATLAISEKTQRLAVVGRSDDRTPTLAQYDLNTGKPTSSIPIAEIDQAQPVQPTGLAYSADGKRLALLFEHDASALLLIYDADTGKKISEFDYPAFAFAAPQHYVGSSLIWLDPSSALLLYGQGVIDTTDGSVLGGANKIQLMIDNVVGQRLLANDQLELLTNDNHISIATLDRAKLQSLLHSPATQP
jgi:hypothetical protein